MDLEKYALGSIVKAQLTLGDRKARTAKHAILNASNRAWAPFSTFVHMNAVGATELYSMAEDRLVRIVSTHD